MEEMRAIAAALKVGPADLISTTALAEIDKDEVVPDLADPLLASHTARGLRVYRVTEDGKSLIRAGIKPGSHLLVDEKKERIANLRMGDVVLVRMLGAEENGDDTPGPIVLRMFFPPDLLLTVREGSDLVIRLDNEDLKPQVVGVVGEP